jgi:hypothetical protein
MESAGLHGSAISDHEPADDALPCSWVHMKKCEHGWNCYFASLTSCNSIVESSQALLLALRDEVWSQPSIAFVC